ncbi:glutamate-5-semialdehyde dehydrogenase [Agromyces aerolatus]|uniref:glutamate-5-semialdehyde dehydrogenase n=1 Tax=Agromyces sp. LY-1074 TaxID=3074080 RepID=UPI0028617BAD|nr:MULTISPECIES: glutamate-5-semialdehyde dehydrogenase [unclassified Agromyces]MDR5700704.1 glutamate-5-semialdehyde dehydrogenase [Agromyces sp. LY-1074]MDR5707225.1 glutamate-5-semialdehyde dehydrogenase [Agromyces sp. LY-1358]
MAHPDLDPALLDARLAAAKEASFRLAIATTAEKDAALEEVARLLRERRTDIVEANEDDLEAGAAAGLGEGLLDRLTLDERRIGALADAVLDVVRLEDPIGETVSGRSLPSGVRIDQVRVPLGVVGAIYEARPNVTIDIAALALKSGNAVVLRGGTAAEHTNRVLVQLLRDAYEASGLPADAVATVDDYGRAGAKHLMQARDYVDVLIPRGSAGLIRAVVDEAKVPVIETGAGVVHMFLDESARVDWAVELVHNAKVQRPSVCNALETLLVHRAAADRLLPAVVERLEASGVTVHGDERVQAIRPEVVPVTDEDWATEHMSLDLSVGIVDSMDEALRHIRRYSTRHTESIVTNDLGNAERFLNEVDAAAVMVNASTRFTDGAEFGFGAEVGISTQKLHARGPMGLPELTSTKWIVRGAGHVRE